jgi:signal transduction histidine kinase
VERREATGAFAAEELARIRQLLDVLPVSVAVYAPNGEIILANQARVAMFGNVTTLEHAVAASDPRREDGTPYPREELPGPRALRGETVAGQRIRLRTVEGRDIVVLGSATPLRDGSGMIVGAVLVLSDITALSELDRGRRELFSMANHDLRTPLSSILVFVDLARRNVADPRRLEDALAKIERAAQRMLRLTGDLLDAARFEAGEIPIDPTGADLTAHVRDAIARQSEAEKIDADLPDEPVRARFDEDRIDQVLDNLVANALKHTGAGTNVAVALTVEGGNAVVRVRDRGAGIMPDERARLFAPFYQTPRGRSYGGTGLGLHISRRIAEAHGGRLWLEDSGPDGSTFTLSLPL